MQSVNLLQEEFEPLGGVTRIGNAFHVTSPWAVARYRKVSIPRGWWKLQSDGADDELEVRIRDDSGLIFTCRPARLGAVNLYVGEAVEADIDLLLSAWPGLLQFRQLSFNRLSVAEVAAFLGRRIARAVRDGRSFARVAGVARRLFSGASFGARADTAEAMPLALDQLLPTLQNASPEVVGRDDFCYALGPSCHLDARALDLVADVFRKRPEVKAVYGDVLQDGTVLPTPKWDENRASWFAFAQPPIFFRQRIEGLTAENAWQHLQESASQNGEVGVARVPLPLAISREPMTKRWKPVPAPQRSSWPTVSVIIPTKHRTDLLTKCLESLRTNTDYPDLEIVVVDNGADGEKLGGLLKAEAAHHRIVCVYDGGGFNFSRLINGGVQASSGEIVLLLNDDVSALEPGWLHRMVDSAMDSKTGAVGARLLYSSGHIQHAGITFGLGGICGHLWRNLPAAEAEANPHIVYPGQRMAVTAACLAVRRAAFDAVGGLDEHNYPVTLNDIDFCLRLNRAGLRTIYRGDAVLLHDESQSRGRDDEELQKRRRRRMESRAFRQAWGHLLDDDPFGSPAFEVANDSGSVHIPIPQLS